VAETIAKFAAEGTAGQIQIQPFAAGEIVSGLLAMDGFGKDPTFVLFYAVPFAEYAYDTFMIRSRARG
jgi:TRAP-type mannitol/chloroaromatic compound transport system substrate-binding protein